MKSTSKNKAYLLFSLFFVKREKSHAGDASLKDGKIGGPGGNASENLETL